MAYNYTDAGLAFLEIPNYFGLRKMNRFSIKNIFI